MNNQPYTKASTSFIDGRFFLQGIVFPTVTYYGTKQFPLRKSIVGEFKPGYKTLIHDRINATTPMTAFSTSLDISRVKHRINAQPGFDGNITDYSCQFPIDNLDGGGYIPPVGLEDSVKARAIASFNQLVKEKQRPFQGQVFLAEFGQTLQLLRNPFKTVLDLTTNLAKSIEKTSKGKRVGRFSNSLIKGVADLQLEYRFAVLPLISDMQSIIELLSNEAKDSDLFRIKVFKEDKVSNSSNSTVGNSLISYNVLDTTSYTSQCIIRSGIFYEHLTSTQSALEKIKDSFIHVEDIPSTVWEALPLSFLSDYFVNIGDFINGTFAAKTYDSYYSMSLIKETLRTSRGIGYSVANPAWFHSVDVSAGFSSYSHKLRKITRTGIQQAIPPIVFHLPGSNVRYANISALLAHSSHFL